MKKYIITRIFVVIMLSFVAYPVFSQTPTGSEEIVVEGDRINPDKGISDALNALQDAFKRWETGAYGTHKQDMPGIEPQDIPVGTDKGKEEEPCEEEADAMADAADALATMMSGKSSATYDKAMAIIENAMSHGIGDASGLTMVVAMYVQSNGQLYHRMPGHSQIFMTAQKLADAINAYNECMGSSSGKGAE